MIEAFAKYDKRQRISIALMCMLGLGYICYWAVIKTPVAKLAAATQKRDELLAAYAGTDTDRSDYALEKTRQQESREQFAQLTVQCFSPEAASEFFDNLKAMAKTHNLEPLSSVIPQSVDVTGPDAESGQVFLQKHSAAIQVGGGYFDIIEFLKALGNRPQKVTVKKLSLELPDGEDLYPTASFQVVCLVNTESEDKE